MPKTQPIRTVAFVSLGCPKNLVDSERMLGMLAEDGFIITADHQQADAIVINTCGFLQAAKEEAIGEIRQAVKLKQTGICRRVIVAGCLAQRDKSRLLAEVPGIDSLVGVFDRRHIVQAVRGTENPKTDDVRYLGKYHDLTQRPRGNETNCLPVFEDDRGRLRLTPRHYAYLRISEGCNQGCSFCTIPSIRGPIRSKPLPQILAEARELAADGTVELNLIGQDTTSYGADIDYKPGLAGLLRELDRRTPAAVRWIRLMYAYPSRFTDEMIQAVAECRRVVKYIDIPLQHINDQMLLHMRRRVTRRQTEVLLGKLRKCIPGIAIRTTLIAGAPGETDEMHQELVRFVAAFGFDMLGVFPYSREPGTPMGRMEDQVPQDVIHHRVDELMRAQQKVAFARAKEVVGETLEVLVDRPADPKTGGYWVARGQHQAPDIDSHVLIKADSLYPGQILEVAITGHDGYDLLGKPKQAKRRLQVIHT
jgi:ribosomal protein S12 methylthiotransferase